MSIGVRKVEKGKSDEYHITYVDGWWDITDTANRNCVCSNLREDYKHMLQFCVQKYLCQNV